MKGYLVFSLLLAVSAATAIAQPSVSDDFWDISQGTVVTSSSDILPGYSAGAIFGENGQNNGNGFTWTYFADWQPPGFTHFVEWETPSEVELGHVRLFAFGDSFLNNGREFDQFTLKAKSVGSSTFDVTVLTFTPTHPYTFIDAPNALILDQLVSPVVSRSFRAEFVQFTAGFNFDGPRIVELDGFPVPPPQPPTIVQGPEDVVVNYAMPALFTVSATGTGTLSYQWYKNGSPLTGQTSDRLRINSVTSNDTGVYSVAVTDNNGTTTSGPATLLLDPFNVQMSSADLFDLRSGIAITANSPLLPGYSAGAMFGENGQNNGNGYTWTYFADGMPTGTVHSVEWTTPNPVTVRTLRLFAFGDGFLNNGREFDTFTLKAKSAGSSTYNLTVVTFKPTHPYTFLGDAWILDQEVTPVTASAFRAEFSQYTAGFGFDGPRIVELDGFSTRPLLQPAVVQNPEAQTVAKNAQVKFSVVARGGNLRYQWKFMGQDIAGATSSTFILKHAKSTDQGYYTVVVSNEVGAATSVPALLLVTR